MGEFPVWGSCNEEDVWWFAVASNNVTVYVCEGIDGDFNVLGANIGNVQVADTCIDRVMNAHDDFVGIFGASLPACIPIEVRYS